MLFHIWTENMWNSNSPAHVYTVGQNGGHLSRFFKVEEIIMICVCYVIHSYLNGLDISLVYPHHHLK